MGGQSGYKESLIYFKAAQAKSFRDQPNADLNAAIALCVLKRSPHLTRNATDRPAPTFHLHTAAALPLPTRKAEVTALSVSAASSSVSPLRREMTVASPHGR